MHWILYLETKKRGKEQIVKDGEKMKELIHIDFQSEQPRVSARELYEGLEVRSKFTTWFRRMAGYGFIENEDYIVVYKQKKSVQENAISFMDFMITVDMAKQICMLQRTEKGKKYRQYFLELEKAWNSPEQVMARALQISQKKVESLQEKCWILGKHVMEQQALVEEMQPKVHYVDQILQSDSVVNITQIAKDYGMSGQAMNELLHHFRIQYKNGEQWVLYANYAGNGYVHSCTTTYVRSGGRTGVSMHTKWTQKGRLFLYDFLKAHEILPCIERSEEYAGRS